LDWPIPLEYFHVPELNHFIGSVTSRSDSLPRQFVVKFSPALLHRSRSGWNVHLDIVKRGFNIAPKPRGAHAIRQKLLDLQPFHPPVRTTRCVFVVNDIRDKKLFAFPYLKDKLVVVRIPGHPKLHFLVQFDRAQVLFRADICDAVAVCVITAIDPSIDVEGVSGVFGVESPSDSNLPPNIIGGAARCWRAGIEERTTDPSPYFRR
jgi:hypothetical protein